jgi:hypothetical protein
LYKVYAAIVLLLASEQPDSFDPRQIPRSERIAYINRIADRAGPDNAREFHDAAIKAITDAWDASSPAIDLQRWKTCQRVFDNEYFLMLAAEWSDEEARAVRTWLDMNAKTIEALTAATDRPTCFDPLVADSHRVYDAAVGHCTSLRQCAKLLAIQANQAALAGDWAAAYTWNGRIYRIANHRGQQPLLFQQMAGMAIERLAGEQLLAFLSRHTAPDLASLSTQLPQQDVHACPDEITAQAESLATLDFIEDLFAWAADPQQNSKVGEIVSIMITPPEWVSSVLPVRSSFKTVEEFRAALQKSSIDSAWQLQQQREEICARWEAKPFAQAWRDLEQFHKELAALAEKAPVQMACDSITGPDNYYYVRALTRGQRHSVAVVLAILQYQQRHGRLPAGLDDLHQADAVCDVTDPFSDEPLRYRTADGGHSFVLYSVGPDQKDDGGKDNHFERGSGDFVYWPPSPPKRIAPLLGP